MSMPEKKVLKVKFIVFGAALAILAALFAAKLFVENKAAERVREDLTMLEPHLKLEQADIKVSLLSSRVTCSNILYSLNDTSAASYTPDTSDTPDTPEALYVPDASRDPRLFIKIGRYIQNGVDLDTLLGRPGDTSTMDSCVIENLTLELPELERPLIELEYYSALDLDYSYRDMRAILLENKGNGDVIAALSKLVPFAQTTRIGGSIGRNLKINGLQDGMADFVAGSFASSGHSELNRENAGFDMGINNLSFFGISLYTEEGYNDVPVSVTIGEINMQGLKYNYKNMLEPFAAAVIGKTNDLTDLAGAAIPNFYDYALDRLELKNLDISRAGTASFRLDSMDLDKRTLKERGSSILRGISLTYGPMDVFTIEEAGLDRFVLSDRIVNLARDPLAIMRDSAVLNGFASSPYDFFRGIRLENLYIKNLNARNMLQLANWRSDLALDGRASLKSAVSRLFLSQDALKQAQSLAGAYPELLKFIQIASTRPDGITLDSNFGLDLLPEAQELSGTLTFALDGDNLGDLKLAVDFVTAAAGEYEIYGDAMLRRLELHMTERGWRDLPMLEGAEETDFSHILEQLDRDIANAKPAYGRLLQAVRDFISSGGTLQISITPLSPVEFENLGDILDKMPDILGISATHSPNGF